MKSSSCLEKLFDIIHEDADLLVVHKPADLVCHPTKGDEYSSLISRARIYFNQQLATSNLTWSTVWIVRLPVSSSSPKTPWPPVNWVKSGNRAP